MYEKTTRSRRASLRHPGHDYTTPGEYFVTACTHGRQWLFGTVDSGMMVPNVAGETVAAVWHQLPEIFPGVMLDAFQLMPDHVHGVVVLGTEPEMSTLHSLGEVMRDFKGRSTTWYFAAARSGIVPRVDGQVWQRGYHDRIIRTERELEQIRSYIAGNPGRWWERRQG
jgi:putative transposase